MVRCMNKEVGVRFDFGLLLLAGSCRPEAMQSWVVGPGDGEVAGDQLTPIPLAPWGLGELWYPQSVAVSQWVPVLGLCTAVG